MSIILTLKMVREQGPDYGIDRIRSSSDAYQLVRQQLEDSDREIFMAIMLDTKNNIIGINTVSIGSLNASIVHPREVFKAALLANAACLVFAHNHPSGDSAPSREDLEITSRLKQAGDILGIRVLDHVIVGFGNYYSMADRGDM